MLKRANKKIKEIRKKLGKAFKPLIITLAALILVYLLKSLFVVAWVNNRPIFRLSLIRELEKQGGKSVLDSFIDKSLVYQEAAKNKIIIKDTEINDELKRIEELVKAQSMSLDEALSVRGQTKKDLINQLRLQKTVERLISDKIKIDEQEIKDAFEKNKSLYGKDASFDNLKEQIKSQLFQQKLSEEYLKWIDELKAKAKIFYFVKY